MYSGAIIPYYTYTKRILCYYKLCDGNDERHWERGRRRFCRIIMYGLCANLTDILYICVYIYCIIRNEVGNQTRSSHNFSIQNVRVVACSTFRLLCVSLLFFYCLNTLENGSHTNFNLIFIFLVFHWNEKKMNANSSDSFK